jgi:oligopeptide transport system permease protein
VTDDASTTPGLREPAGDLARGIARARFGWSGRVGLGVLLAMVVACLASLPWTMGSVGGVGGVGGVPRYNRGATAESLLPPWWVAPTPSQAQRLDVLALASKGDRPSWALGTDALGRSLLVRVLAGGGISLTVGIAAALLSVCIGVAYGAIAGYAGGRVDAIMMRAVDVLYGLPYVLLVVLLAVAGDALVGEHVSRHRERQAWTRERVAEGLREEGQSPSREAVEARLASDAELRARVRAQSLEAVPPRALGAGARTAIDLVVLLVAIGGVSWLTMARVIRGQVLSLKAQPFVEAARAIGAGPTRILARHVLPNLIGPIVVYATLTVPQAILQESFLSFLGIGVKPPLPSWGNLAAEGLGELNPYQSHWWLLAFPCALLGATLLSLNFVGEGLREALDPKRRAR